MATVGVKGFSINGPTGALTALLCNSRGVAAQLDLVA